MLGRSPLTVGQPAAGLLSLQYLAFQLDSSTCTPVLLPAGTSLDTHESDLIDQLFTELLHGGAGNGGEDPPSSATAAAARAAAATLVPGSISADVAAAAVSTLFPAACSAEIDSVTGIRRLQPAPCRDGRVAPSPFSCSAMIPPPSSDFGQEACGRLTLTFPRPVMIDEERRLGDLALRLGRHLSQLLKEREEVMFENISQEVQASPATGAALVHAASCAPAQLPPAASLLAKAKSI